MLLEWRLANFKSVTSATRLPLAPLTIFAGANSAGKSTILQSILLTSQTVQSPVVGRPVVLNGTMARLGSFSDIASGGDEASEIRIGFELNMQSHEEMAPTFRRPRHIFYRTGAHFRSVSMDFSFTAQPGPNDHFEMDLLRLQPLLTRSIVVARYLEGDSAHADRMKETTKEATIEIRRSSEKIEDRARELKLDGAEVDQHFIGSLQYEITRAPANWRPYEIEGLKVRPELVGAVTHHFFPRILTGRYDHYEAETKWKLALLTEPRRSSHFGKFQDYKVSKDAAHIIASVLRDALETSDEDLPPRLSAVRKERLHRAISRFSESCDLREMQRLGPHASFVFSHLSAKRPEIEKAIRDNKEPLFVLGSAEPSEQLDAAIGYAHFFFMRCIKYLGPLRDEPKPVYPLVGSSDPADVGLRGEHTAAVLHVHKNTAITYMPSARFTSADDAAQTVAAAGPVQGHLAAAVQDWLVYMGVGKDVSTNDLGKLGHELKIISEDSGLQHDLTQVGVGVSQVLPILVLALLADPGTTLIFEQPELHLHPRVQSRLADFFVSMTMLGKQCLVETHSEYLINRLRYRAAVDDTNEVANSSMIYFVQKEGVQSVYRKINIDSLGSLDAWPPGFFDESERATTDLLKAGLRKRRVKKQ